MGKQKIKVTNNSDGSATAVCPQCSHEATITPRPEGKGRTGTPPEVAVAAIKGHLIARHGAELGQYF